MPLTVTCACGAAFRLKDEFAGKRLKCPKCQATLTAPALEPQLVATAVGAVAPTSGHAGTLAYRAPDIASGVFDRDKFLLRQKMMSLHQKYTVSDEMKQPIAYIVRRSHIGRSLLAGLAAIVAMLVAGGIVGSVFYGIAMAASNSGKPDEFYFGIGVICAIASAIVAAIVVAVILSPKRHIEFFKNEATTEKLLEIKQDQKLQLIVGTFTLLDDAGQPLALFRKNFLWNLIRRRWHIYAPDGTTLLAMAFEDSIILSLLRRFIGGAIGAIFLRTNFIITRGNSEDVIGEFNRKFTIVDRYVLDMTADPQRSLDRRICLALGVLLDTGERR